VIDALAPEEVQACLDIPGRRVLARVRRAPQPALAGQPVSLPELLRRMLGLGVVHPDPDDLLPRMREHRLHHLEPEFGRPHAVDGGDQDALDPKVGAGVADAVDDPVHGRRVGHTARHVVRGIPEHLAMADPVLGSLLQGFVRDPVEVRAIPHRCDDEVEHLEELVDIWVIVEILGLAIRGQGHTALTGQRHQRGRLDTTREMHVEAHLGEALEECVEVHGVSFPLIDPTPSHKAHPCHGCG
jgi:hypothetical protein